MKRRSYTYWVLFGIFLLSISSYDVFASCMQDTIPPQFVSFPEDIESCYPVVVWPKVKVIDDCGYTKVVSNYTSGTRFPVGTTVVTYSAKDKMGNESVLSFTVTIHPLLEADAGLDMSVCEDDDMITLGENPSAMGGTPGYSYYWYTNDQPLQPVNVANPQVQIQKDTVTFFLQVKDANECVGTDEITVIKHPSISSGAAITAFDKLNKESLPFGNELSNQDMFGHSIATVDYDETTDQVNVIIGAPGDDTGGDDRGAIYNMKIDANSNNLISYYKISDQTQLFQNELRNGDQFGFSVAHYGDMNGDSYPDYIVGSPFRDNRLTNQGSVWFIYSDGNEGILMHNEISESYGGFYGALGRNDRFGWSVTTGQDFDLDGINDLFVGAPYDDRGGVDQGAVWHLKMTNFGGVFSAGVISETSGGLGPVLDKSDHFGSAVQLLPDMNGNLVPELAVGAPGDDDGAVGTGAVYILFLNSNAAIDSIHKISAQTDMFSWFTSQELNSKDYFGSSLAWIGDANNDGVPDIAVGAPGDSQVANEAGAFWILLLNSNGTVKSTYKIEGTDASSTSFIDIRDQFSCSLAAIPSDPSSLQCYPNLMTGAIGDDGISSNNTGAVYSIDLGEPLSASQKQENDYLEINLDGTENITMNIFPNPSDGLFQLTFDHVEKDVVFLELVDIYGENVLSQWVNTTSSNIQLSLKNQPKGIYFVKVQVDGQYLSTKLVLK